MASEVVPDAVVDAALMAARTPATRDDARWMLCPQPVPACLFGEVKVGAVVHALTPPCRLSFPPTDTARTNALRVHIMVPDAQIRLHTALIESCRVKQCGLPLEEVRPVCDWLAPFTKIPRTLENSQNSA